jgi:hypothetical protein
MDAPAEDQTKQMDHNQRRNLKCSHLYQEIAAVSSKFALEYAEG